MKKHLCIHGHFYQPPRENPWLNEVELQDSAYPYHDWNDRITAECYARNAASRILGEKDQIVDIVNNYSRISFNFGPTLLEWMAKKQPEAYQAILQADQDSQQRYGGHGSALAQAYNHTILPLSNARDLETQVIWGIRDFELRFGRKPEGMWCGETAVNTEVLEMLALHKIKFTILSPYQARNYRKIGEKEWHDGTGAKIDPRHPYLYRLPSGREIVLFFYDGPVSQGVAFEKLLNSGERFAGRLVGTFSDNEKPELMHIATDGETYGHHHRFGEMALTYALYHIETENLANLTIYGEYLEHYPPEFEAQIIENSSWSCYHGVERWRSNCGCQTGGQPGWNQEWRGPLRKTFDWVRDTLAPVYEAEMGHFASEPWEIRNRYIEVVFNRSEQNVAEFFRVNFKKNLNEQEKITILKLLEMQYHAMLMYTSCGWFFDEVTGLESMQDILYAARALQLASEITGTEYEPDFMEHLAMAESNGPEFKNAAEAYESLVKPTMLDMLRVGVHYAISSLFNNYPAETQLYCYQVKSRHHEELEAGRQRLGIGQASLKSDLTWETAHITYAVLHLGEHQLFAGVRLFQSEEAYQHMRTEIVDSFERSNIHEIIYLLDKHFGAHNYSFWHLFRDDQRQILSSVLETTLVGVDTLFRRLYETNYPIMQALKQVNMNLPPELKNIHDFVLNADLKVIFASNDPDMESLERTINNAKRFPAELDILTLNYSATNSLTRLMKQLAREPENTSLMNTVMLMVKKLAEINLEPELWEARNIAFSLHRRLFKEHETRSRNGDETSQEWCDNFNALYESLNLKA